MRKIKKTLRKSFILVAFIIATILWSIFVYLIEGEIKIGNKSHEKIKDSTLILLTQGDELKVEAITKSKFLLVSGKPIGEQIARGGPFVMNTKAEILEAINDYQRGTFVK